MTNFLFIRHGAHDYLGCAIAGRLSGVHLNELGRRQAEQLAAKVSLLPIDAVYSSPLERARETAEPTARQFGLPIHVAEEFTEIDFGDWTDRPFVELNDVPRWQHFNRFRSSTSTPEGELMLEVQTRVLRKLSQLREAHRFVAIFTHGDAIRATLAHFLGVHLDLFQRIEIDPAALSIVECGDDFTRVRLINTPWTGSPLELPTVRHQ